MPASAADVAAILAPSPRRSALQEYLASFPAQIRRRGAEYADAGLVGALQIIGGDMVFADVRGTRTYETSWQWDGRAWEEACSCPMGLECKHAFALATVMLRQAEAPAASPRRATPGSPANTRSTFTVALDQLRQAPDSWSRFRPLQMVLNQLQHRDLWASDERFADVIQEDDADLRCLRLADALFDLGSDVPAGLRQYADDPALRHRLQQGARDRLRRELLAWVDRHPTQSQRSLRFRCSLVPSNGSFEMVLVGLVSSARLDNEPRSPAQLAQLRNDAHRNNGALPAQQVALLDALAAAGLLGSGRRVELAIEPSTTRTLLELDRGQGNLVWSEDLPEDQQRNFGLVPGSNVELMNDLVRITPDIDECGGEIGVCLVAAWSDGRRVPFERVALLESRRNASLAITLIATEGKLWPVVELPPAGLRHEFAAQGRLALEEQERQALLPLLAERFAPLRQSLRQHTRVVPVRAVLTCELRSDDWLQVRAYACPAHLAWSPGQADPPGLFEYDPVRGWCAAVTASEELTDGTEPDAGVPATAPAAIEAAPEVQDVWLEMPDPSVTEAVSGWLESIGAVPGNRGLPGGYMAPREDRELGWWLRFTAASAERFLEAWPERPEGLYLGNTRLQRLLSGKAAVAPVVEIESSGTDWFQVSAGWRTEGLSLTQEEIDKLRNATTRLVRLPSGWVQRDAVEIDDAAVEQLADLGVEVGLEAQRVTLWQLAGADPDTLAALDRFGGDAALVAKLSQLRQRIADFRGLPEVDPPAALQAELRPYQKRGLDFLCYTSELGIGAVLADDMGLGKTVQALAWLAWLKQKRRGSGPALVVCPASVVHNWVREAERFVPSMRILVLGRGPERKKQRRRWQKFDLIVTNYALFRQDQDFWHDIGLRGVIFDEAQNLKNPDAAVTRVARKLQAKHRLALTGTPFENRALDLWSIVDLLTPGYLGSRSSFSARFDRTELPSHQRRLLAAKLRPILLRRMKKEVASELPERIEERIDCELTSGQRRVYLAELRRCRALIDELSESPEGLERNRIHVLAALTRLRQICCHPELAGSAGGSESGKFEALFELLEPLLDEGHKVLVFSQFVRCLELLAAEMQQRQIRHHILTGATTQRERVVAEFQEDPQASVFLISLKAGGTGLNLTAASYVVLFDPWWNPAVEAQAIDRSHRIGQDKTVIAYRLISLGTVEEKIWEMQQRKAELARDLLGEDGFARTLSRHDLEFLLAET